MNATDSAPARLLPTAALASLLVLLLGATGLFALSYTHVKSVAALERLGWLHTAQLAAVKAQVSFKTQVQEWKNILLRGADPKDYATYLGRFEQREADVRAGLAALQEEFSRLGLDSSAAGNLVAAHTALGATYHKALAAYRPESRESAFTVDASVRGIDRQFNDDLDALARSVHQVAESDIAAFRTAGDERYATLRKITLTLAGLTVLIAFWLVFQTVRSPSAVARTV